MCHLLRSTRSHGLPIVRMELLSLNARSIRLRCILLAKHFKLTEDILSNWRLLQMKKNRCVSAYIDLFRAYNLRSISTKLTTNWQLFIVVDNIVHYCWAWINPQSGVTMLNNIVDNYELNVGSTTLLHPVFINLEQVIIFWRVRLASLSYQGLPTCILYSISLLRNK